MANAVTVFQGVGTSLENATKTFVSDVVANTITTIYPWAISGLTLYIILYGYMVMMGHIEEAASTSVIKIAKIIVISALALNADVYLNMVMPAIQGIGEGLTAAFSGNKEGGSIYQTLDNALGRGIDLVLHCHEKAAEGGLTQINVVIGWYLVALLFIVGMVPVVVLGGVAIVVSTLYLKLLLAIGPFFILGLMFPVTSKFFDSWIGYAMNHMLVVAIMGAVLALGLNIYEEYFKRLAEGQDALNMLRAALEMLVAGAILAGATQAAGHMASSLAGGISMAISSRRDLKNAAQDVGKDLKTAASPVIGAYKAGKWAAGKFDRGNSVSNASGSSQPELGFRQTVRKHLYGKAAND